MTHDEIVATNNVTSAPSKGIHNFRPPESEAIQYIKSAISANVMDENVKADTATFLSELLFHGKIADDAEEQSAIVAATPNRRWSVTLSKLRM